MGSTNCRNERRQLSYGKIVNIEDYGAFLEIQPGVEGLIHVSEVTWSNQPINAREFFKLGQMYDAKIVTIDREDRKMSLSIKKISQDPWTEIETKFPVDSRHTGAVKNLTPYGVFVELEEGIGGMVHISDLSWTKRFSHPSEFTKVGNDIEIVILEIDKGSRKLSLGHKQIEENPWDTFETVFPIGSYHEATILRRDDRGAIVHLTYGLEAFAPIKHVKKEDNTLAEVDETLTVKVIEFNRDDKRILVSHLRYLDDIRREADDAVRKEKTAERQQTRSAVKSQQSKVERTTLGELDAFSQLKQQLKDDAAAAAKSKLEKMASTPKPKPVEEEVIEVETEEAITTADDFKKIEGVGPKIEALLHNAAIKTYVELSEVSVDKIKEILTEAGSRYKMHDPTTWPDQAKMAAAGEWDKLKEWQDSLQGGKE